MNRQMLFWIPAALRLMLVLAPLGVVWYFFGYIVAMGVGMLAMLVLIVVQLDYLYQLSNWLDNPQNSRLPDGWGAWTDVFARIYRMRRDDEHNRTELSEWLARFRQAMSLLPDGVAIMDDVLFLEWCNPEAERHLGLSLERDRGMRVTNLVRSPDFIDYIVLGRYDQPLNLTWRERKLLVHIIPFENRRQILVTHDVTEAERIDMMRRDFIANASHELRTPLTVINGFLEIGAGSEHMDDQTRVAHLKLMLEQGQRMQRLVDDMLALTRLESVDTPVREEPVNIASLLERILREAQALSGGRHTITLSIDGPDVRGSSEELDSAFGNLASNAVRYTPDGGTIAMHWRDTKQGPQFQVSDDGPGIKPEDLPRLTERFYRIDKSRSRKTQGTGLGLAIVKHVMIRHGGSLAISSELGKGSTFTAQFPHERVYYPE